MLIHLTMSGNDGHVLLGDEFPANGVERGHLGLKSSFWKKGTCELGGGSAGGGRGVSVVTGIVQVVQDPTCKGLKSMRAAAETTQC